MSYAYGYYDRYDYDYYPAQYTSSKSRRDYGYTQQRNDVNYYYDKQPQSNYVYGRRSNYPRNNDSNNYYDPNMFYNQKQINRNPYVSYNNTNYNNNRRYQNNRRYRKQYNYRNYNNNNNNNNVLTSKSKIIGYDNRERTVDVIPRKKDNTFENFNLRPELMKALKEKLFIKPSPVQEESIPSILMGESILCRSKNGTGKTLAYSLPLVQKIDEKSDHIQGLVLVPTRELALQTSAFIMDLIKYIKNMRVVLSTGGTSLRHDIIRMKAIAHIVVATPGRLLDLASNAHCKLGNCYMVVMDEADKLLSADFIELIDDIMKYLPPFDNEKKRYFDALKKEKEKQEKLDSDEKKDTEKDKETSETEKKDAEKKEDTSTQKKTTKKDSKLVKFKQRQLMLFSATFPQTIKDFVDKYMNEKKGDQRPKQLNLMNELTLIGISQYYTYLKEKQKVHCLITLLKKLIIGQCIIFCKSVNRVELLASKITKLGFSCFYTHAKMQQNVRNRVFHEFRQESFNNQPKCRILVCTDLITRGIDIQAVNVVVNFDFPKAAETYLHRIGRAGRFGHRALAINFITDGDREALYNLEKDLNTEIKPIPGDIDKIPTAEYPVKNIQPLNSSKIKSKK